MDKLIDRKQNQPQKRARCVWILILLLSLAFARTSKVVAQTESDFGISQLRVQIMPEFDDPRVLVIIQGRVDVPEDQFPVQATFSVPRGAQINQMAVMDIMTGATEMQEYDIAVDPANPDATLVTYTLTGAHFFYEYYYDPFTIDGDHKAFTFTFNSQYPVDDLGIEVQQPLRSTEFTLEPEAAIAQFDESMGFTFHSYALGAINPDETITIAVSYLKSDSDPSITREELAAMQTGGQEMLEAIDASPSTGSTPSALDSNTAVFIVLGIAVVIVVGIIAWRSGRHSGGVNAVSVIATPPSSGKKRTDFAPVTHPQDQPRYCSQCGAPLKPNARFCHQCGQAVDE